MQACGSGATTAGLAIANSFMGCVGQVHGYGVCDDEDYFYDFIDNLAVGLGLDPEEASARDMVSMVQCKGAGYAISRCGSS